MRLLVAAVALLAASACSSPAPVSPYAGTVWTLDRIVDADGSVSRGSGDERLTLGADGSIAVQSCNLCNGRFSTDDDVLTVAGGAMACTRRACLDGQVELERAFAGPVGLERDGPTLTVSGADGAQYVFVAETMAAPESN